MERKFRIALCGLGNMGRNHCRVLLEDPRFQLVAILDPMPAEVPAIAANLPVVNSLEKLNRFDFDCAVVATPTETHYEIVEMLLHQGKHVLVEKPAASTYEQSLALMELARLKNLMLCVGNIERCNPAVSLLHDIVKTGVLGRIVHADATRAGRFPGQVKPGNHVILDLAVHELDVLRLIFGPLMILHSFCHATTLPGIYDTAEIMAATPGGMSASVHVNWLTPQRIRQLRLTGTQGVVELDYIGQGCTVFGQNLAERMPGMADFAFTRDTFCERAHFQAVKAEPLKVQLGEFYNFLLGKEHRLCHGEALAESVLMAEQCSKNARSGVTV